jgi:hypothetical protein
VKFSSVRGVTSQFDALVVFYEKLTGIKVTHLAPGFAQLRLEGCTLAISNEEIIKKVNGEP